VLHVERRRWHLAARADFAHRKVQLWLLLIVALYNFVTGSIVKEYDAIPIDIPVPPANSGLQCGSVVTAQGEREVVIVIGRNSAILSFANQEWRIGPTTPDLHRVVTAVQLDDTFVVIGGDKGPANYAGTRTMFLFNATTYQFDLLEQQLEKSRLETTAIAVPDRFVCYL